MLKYLGPNPRKQKWILFAFLILTLVVGAALAALLPRPATIVIAAVLLGLVMLLVTRVDPALELGPIDWDTAAIYERELKADLSPEIVAMQTEVQDGLAARLRAPHVHLFRVNNAKQILGDHSCGRECRCEAVLRNCMVLASHSHPVIIIGARLLEDAGILRMVLGHETRHAHRMLRTSGDCIKALLIAGWGVLGLTVPLPWIPLAVALLLMALIIGMWGVEIVCDIAAARHPQADARRAFAAQRAATSNIRHWRLKRLIQPFPHPPLVLRIAIVTWLARLLKISPQPQ